MSLLDVDFWKININGDKYEPKTHFLKIIMLLSVTDCSDSNWFIKQQIN